MVFSITSLASGAANNLLVLLGAAFVLSRGLAVLAGRPARARTAWMGLAFAATAIASIMVSFPIAPGVIGDLRNAVIAIAALTGGPVAALVTALAAAAYRILLGGHVVVAVGGIAATAALAIGFCKAGIARRPLNLALFGLALAVVNASLPLAAALFEPGLAPGAWPVAAAILATAAPLYPLAILVVGGFLTAELKRLADEGELRSLNARLHENERRFGEVFDLSSVAMAWGDIASRRLLRVNARYAAFTGYSEEELLGMRVTDLALPEDRAQDESIVAPLAAGTANSFTEERRYLRKDGSVAWGLRSLTVARDGGVPRYIFAMVQDITEQKRDREKIAYLAEHDPLTGLANRRVIYERLDAALAELVPGAELAVLYLDLDEFKDINDTIGHLAGDALLVQVAGRLKACTRDADVLARLSGDGFAVLCPGPGADEARELVRRILALVGTPFEVEDQTITLRASIGVAIAPRDGTGSGDLFKKADIALDAAKTAGRGTFRFFQPAMESDLRARQLLKGDLANALANDELVIVYQPVLSLATGEVSAFEALIRWRHPEKGEIPPARFIPIAEETGLIGKIGDWVLEQACAEAAKWPGRIGLAVNVSPRQFQTRTLPLHVATALLAADLSPRRLELEITESVLFQGSEANLAILHDLRDLGVTIALDDFGTGYSALGYLRRFPIDRIKIDRIFVGDLSDSEESKAVVGAVVGLGRALGMRVTAEGVETKRQLDEIRARGCDEAQGFYFSRPVAAAEIPALLARLSPAASPAAVAG